MTRIKQHDSCYWIRQRPPYQHIMQVTIVVASFVVKLAPIFNKILQVSTLTGNLDSKHPVWSIFFQGVKWEIIKSRGWVLELFIAFQWDWHCFSGNGGGGRGGWRDHSPALYRPHYKQPFVMHCLKPNLIQVY